jgi:hypothetical protein
VYPIGSYAGENARREEKYVEVYELRRILGIVGCEIMPRVNIWKGSRLMIMWTRSNKINIIYFDSIIWFRSHVNLVPVPHFWQSWVSSIWFRLF